MEVTKSNFHQLLPQIKEAINKSDFIAIDCELTGLNTGYDINAYDTQRQYYEKVRRSSKEFLVIQYGLCIFRYDRNLKVFKQQAYNFYIFPRPNNKYVPDHRFLCQASSIDFLIEQGFDFNKLFKEGIPYLNSNEEDKYRTNLKEKQKTRANQLQNSLSPQNDKSNNIISMTIDEKTFVDDVFKRIEEFIISDKEEVLLPKCNAYVRRLVYQEAKKRIGNRACLETRQVENSKDRLLAATRVKSREEKEQEEKLRVKEEEEEMNKSLGFSEVVKAIISSGKLVVGHNMCLDVLHTIDKFLTYLPENYEEFRELAHCSFSNFIDTKYMSSVEPFKELIPSNVLSHLLKTVSKEPFAIPTVDVAENGQGYKLENSKEHEAGYDAFITGLSFLAMWQYLGTLEESDDPFIDFSFLHPYKNRLFLMRLQDAPYIHVGGNDPVPPREHVLYITFPKEWKLNDIMQLFSPFGNVYVAWIDDRSAYVGLQKRDQTAIALSTLSQSDTYTVMSYAKRQAQLAGHVLPFSPPSSRRKRSLENATILPRKRGSTSFGESSSCKRKRSIDQIVEDPDEPRQSKTITEDLGVPLVRAPSVIATHSKTKKAFHESSEWD